MNPRRLYAPVVLATLAAGGLGFFAAGRTWAAFTVTTEGLPSDKVEVTGTDALPLVSALAIVIVTSALAIFASGRRTRRVVGIFTVVVALTGLWLLVGGGDTLDKALSDAVKASPAYTGDTPSGSAERTIWQVVTGVAFVLSALLGAMTTRFGPSWATMGSRYERADAHSKPVEPTTDSEMWKALDEGRDPTE